MDLKPLKKNVVPTPPASIWKLLGPSFIMLGLGLGTGELILWPYLTSNWGLGIIWGALLGITIQFFLNMEIERYALANGESIFVGFARLFKKIPYWFIASTILAWSWPGFSAAAALSLSYFGITQTTPIAIGMLVLVGLILTVGPVLYKTVERFQMFLIILGIPLIVIITIATVSFTDVTALFKGLIGIGDGFRFIPPPREDANGILMVFPLMTFLAAVAYSGAGGNLMLAQSFYIKEKGYAMGKYAGRITSLITGKDENPEIEGSTYEANEKNIENFNRWWSLANREHLIVFWGLGLFTMLLLALLAYSTVYQVPGIENSISFIFAQAEIISVTVGSLFGALLIIVTCLMLFSTQLSVIDAAGRIVTENIAILKREKVDGKNMPKVYYGSVWTLITFGIIVLAIGMDEPKRLIIIGAVLNAFCMFVFSGILNKTNMTLLPDSAKPPAWRRIIVNISFVIMGIFTLLVVLDKVIPDEYINYLLSLI